MSDTSIVQSVGGTVATSPPVPETAPPGSSAPTDGAADAAGKAKEVGTAGLDQAKAVATDAKDQATELAAHAGDQAKKAVAMTKDELRALADDRTQQLCRGLRSLSDQFGAISTGDEGGVVQDVGRDVGQRVGTLADRLEDGGLDGAVRQITSLAQRRPGAFLAGAAAAGFLAARVLRDTKDVVADAPAPTDDHAETAPDAAFDEPIGFPAQATPIAAI